MPNKDIPHKIHYCWFGGNQLPKSAIKCIESWKKYFPDYEIIEWNESNYDVRKIPYIAQAYDAKKYAFVSDYARFDILYHEGGIYFDTDVEVIKSFDDILSKGAFMGCELVGLVAPGLGIGAPAHLALFKEILAYYESQSFINSDMSINTETVVTRTTNILRKYGFSDSDSIQTVSDIYIYPQDFFSPKDSRTGKLTITENTHSIHWYSMSWLSGKQRIRKRILDPFHRIFGPDCFRWIKNIIGK